MADVQGWFKNLPVFTRYWFGLTVGLTLAAKIGILSGSSLILNEDFIRKFHVRFMFTAVEQCSDHCILVF